MKLFRWHAPSEVVWLYRIRTIDVIVFLFLVLRLLIFAGEHMYNMSAYEYETIRMAAEGGFREGLSYLGPLMKQSFILFTILTLPIVLLSWNVDEFERK